MGSPEKCMNDKRMGNTNQVPIKYIFYIFKENSHSKFLSHPLKKRDEGTERGCSTILTFPQNLVITIENKVCHLENVHDITETEV